MKEVFGNLWIYLGQSNTNVLITTNGDVKKNGECVMGRGCARQARDTFPGLALELGKLITTKGNKVHQLKSCLYSFPVKHHYWEKADLKLIRQSALRLKYLATQHPEQKWVLPRPGCSNGKRTWAEVKPLLEDLPDNVHVITYYPGQDPEQ